MAGLTTIGRADLLVRKRRTAKGSAPRIARCVVCGSGRIGVKRVAVEGANGTGRSVEAEVCLVCGERYFSREAAEAILAVHSASAGRPAKGPVEAAVE